MTELTHFSLFSGIGGFDLAAEWAGFRTVCFVEKDDYCQKVLKKHWPGVPIIGDIRDVKGKEFEAVTLVTGGFPCQSFSHAGKRKGKADDRYLWPEMFRVIKLIRPTWVLAENVPGIIRLALNDVLSDLESEGYSTETLIIPACAVNAPHRRDRVWIVANNESGGLRPQLNKITDKLLPENGTPQKLEIGSRYVADTEGQRLEGADPKRNTRPEGCLDEYRQGGWNPDWWAVESDVCRVAHGISHRVDRLKCLGNTIVPQVAYQVLKVVAEIEQSL